MAPSDLQIPITEKKPDTKFKKGVPANRTGRPKGSKDKHKMLIATLNRSLANGAKDVLETVIRRAKAGDMRAAKMLLDRLLPVHKAVDPALAGKTQPVVNITIKAIEDLAPAIEVIDVKPTPTKEDKDDAS